MVAYIYLALTYGQPATPTSLGKEFKVFFERINTQIECLNNIVYKSKFGGATGNFNSLYYTYPDIDWNKFGDEFLDIIGLERNQFTTQIDHYDNHSIIFDIFKRIGVILIDFCQDIWLYISRNIFKLKVIKGEVGSSAMPHKVNPIDFENAEANFAIANNWFNFFSNYLPVSRMQRDLRDSTVSRNFGVAFGHFIVGLDKFMCGLGKLEPNLNVIEHELNDNLIVLSEIFQVFLRGKGIENGYEILKEITRGKDIKNIKLNDFKNLIFENIQNVDGILNEEDKNKLMSIKIKDFMGFINN